MTNQPHMIPESISLIERQLLINQCKILSAIGNEDERELYEKRIEILEKGYPGFYRLFFNNFYDVGRVCVYN